MRDVQLQDIRIRLQQRAEARPCPAEVAVHKLFDVPDSLPLVRPAARCGAALQGTHIPAEVTRSRLMKCGVTSCADIECTVLTLPQPPRGVAAAGAPQPQRP